MKTFKNIDLHRTPSQTIFEICVLDGVLEKIEFHLENQGSLVTHERSRLEKAEVPRA